MTAGVPQADGTRKVEPRMDVRHVAESGGLYGEPAAGRQRAIHDRDGHQNAVYREGMKVNADRGSCVKNAKKLTTDEVRPEYRRSISGRWSAGSMSRDYRRARTLSFSTQRLRSCFRTRRR